MRVGNSNTDQTRLICELTVVANTSPAIIFSTLPFIDWQPGAHGCCSGEPSKLHIHWGGDLHAVIVCRRAVQRLITWWNQHKLVMITLPGVSRLSNSTDRILTPTFHKPVLFTLFIKNRRTRSHPAVSLPLGCVTLNLSNHNLICD